MENIHSNIRDIVAEHVSYINSFIQDPDDINVCFLNKKKYDWSERLAAIDNHRVWTVDRIFTIL